MGSNNMIDKNKWKTYPCKECIVKGKCSEYCFEYPLDRTIIHTHIKENNLRGICLACGSMNINGMCTMTCEECCEKCYAHYK